MDLYPKIVRNKLVTFDPSSRPNQAQLAKKSPLKGLDLALSFVIFYGKINYLKRDKGG